MANRAAHFFAWTLLIVSPAFAIDKAETVPTTFPIESYEPNRVGYAWQNDDVGFIDFTVSLKYQLFPELTRKTVAKIHLLPYFAFTGGFGFYLRTRDSDPVIGKHYTPKLILRYLPEPNAAQGGLTYLDFAYAHESNGQTTHTAAKYLFDQRTAERPEFALDEVSRGWDYAQIAGKYVFDRGSNGKLSLFGDLKFFMPDGLVQGRAEEVHPWENEPSARPRRAYQGVLLAAERFWNNELFLGLNSPRVLVQYETGYDPAFRFRTFQVELGARAYTLPIAVWYRNGYGHSLARYYKDTQAFGIEFRFAE